jgi:hypothetical protein
VKALTLTQPWASLVVLGVKHWETRGWVPWVGTLRECGGRIAIHAAKGWTRDDRDFAAELHERGILPVAPADLPLGAVLGEATIVGLARTTTPMALELSDLEHELGDYSPGRYAWELGRVAAYPEPIPARGMLGLWEWVR